MTQNQVTELIIGQNLKKSNLPKRDVNYSPYTIRKEKRGSGVSSNYISGGYRRKDLPSKSILRRLHEINSTRMVICITMYNEDKKEFLSTMRGVMHDVHRIIQAPQPIINPRSQLVVVLIADGLEKVNADFLKHMRQLGLYSQDKLIEAGFLKYNQEEGNTEKLKELYKSEEQKKTYQNNVVHCFARDDIYDFGFEPKDYDYIYGERIKEPMSINFIFAIKHNNGGKLNSHLFYFHGFCQYLNPTYATLIDIGTEPINGAISKLLNHMNLDLNCGGCCGEIEVETKGSNCLNFIIIYAQYFEYKISNYLDKSAEQFYGFISVLPGAFSMFRLDSIRGRPLKQYFAGLNTANNSCFKANMYLAEDRIQCLEILTHQGQKNNLAFVSGAAALTDPPESLGVLLKQRRRWINGSNFAQFYVISNFCRLSKTTHSKCKKCSIYLFYTYYMINAFFTFIIVGMFYASFSIIIRQFQQNQNSVIVRLLENVYLALLGWMILISLTADAKLVSCQIQAISIFYGLIMYLFIGLAYFYFIATLNDESQVNNSVIRIFTIAAMFIVILSQIVPLCINCRRCNPCKLLLGFFSYLFLTPTYINLFICYAFCNVHDVSWGNRDSATLDDKRKGQEFKLYRSRVLSLWLLMNMLSGYLMNLLARGELNSSANEIALLIFSIFVAFTVTFRLISSICSKFICYRVNRAKKDTIRNRAQKPWETPKEPKMLQRILNHFDRDYSDDESFESEINASPPEKNPGSVKKEVPKTLEKKTTQNYDEYVKQQSSLESKNGKLLKKKSSGLPILRLHS